jgi:carboxylesterase
MDASESAPFRLDPPAGLEQRGAVLLLHGFTGSPWEVRPLGESLAARGYHAYAPQLPGHGTTPEAMLYVTHVDWEREAERALHALKGFRDVYVAGLSMGSLLALLLAARFPERVKALALMAPALKLRSRGARVLEVLRVLNRHPFDELWVRKLGSDLEDEAVRASAPLLPRYPAARLRDMFALQRLAASAVPQVRCPALVVVAEHDHVIDLRAALALEHALREARLVRLQRGFHLMPRDVDRARLATEVGGFFDGLIPRGAPA